MGAVGWMQEGGCGGVGSEMWVLRCGFWCVGSEVWVRRCGCSVLGAEGGVAEGWVQGAGDSQQGRLPRAPSREQLSEQPHSAFSLENAHAFAGLMLLLVP